MLDVLLLVDLFHCVDVFLFEITQVVLGGQSFSAIAKLTDEGVIDLADT